MKSDRSSHSIPWPWRAQSKGRVVTYMRGRQTRHARPAIKKGTEPPLICSFRFIIRLKAATFVPFLLLIQTPGLLVFVYIRHIIKCVPIPDSLKRCIRAKMATLATSLIANCLSATSLMINGLGDNIWFFVTFGGIKAYSCMNKSDSGHPKKEGEDDLEFPPPVQ